MSANKVKLDIVSGFLGAGKTTLIKKLVSDCFKDEKIVVLENEFGKISIDGDILKNTGVTVEEITAGCICCSSSGDFLSSISDLISAYNPHRIIVEPTGVAKLSEILSLCNQIKYRDLFEINNIISVVDVKRFDFITSYSKGFVDDQIRASKTIVLSKNENLDNSSLEEIYSYIKDINLNVNIVNKNIKEISGSELLEAIRVKIDDYDYNIDTVLEKINNLNLEHIHYHFSTVEFKLDKKIDYEDICLLFDLLEDEKTYGKIVRGKGILQDTQDKYYKFDYVEKRIDKEDYYKSEFKMICIIGYNLNKTNILRLFI